METQLVIQALRATTSPGDQSQATTYLNNCSAMIGFPSILVSVLRDPTQDGAVRQAAVIFLKNLVNRAWSIDESEVDKITPVSEQDKVVLRSQIIDLIVDSPEAIRIQLAVCMQSMLRNDFPDKWVTQNGVSVTEEIVRLLNSGQGDKYLAALLITYRLTKIYEYKRHSDKGPFIAAMQQILPILHVLFKSLLQVPSKESCLLQKMILKVFYCLIQFSLNTQLFTPETFSGWFEIFISIIEREVPQEVDALAADEKEATVYWKCKKWALKIIDRVFERYGSKGHVEKMYEEFAELYTNNFATHAVNSVIRILSQHSNGVYVSERVLHLAISHLAEALSHSHIWKMIKNDLMGIFTTVLFPLMKHNDDDEELWSDDPEAYLREKVDCWEELHSTTAAATKFLAAATKRKGVLQPVLAFVIAIFENPNSDPRDVDGALNTVASLADFLSRDKRYKKDVEKLLYVHVRPRITSPHRFIRAHALHVITEAGATHFSNRNFLNELTELITQRLQDTNEELPVKFEAALAIQSLISHQEEIHQFVRPRIRELLTEVLRLLKQVQLEDLPVVVESLIENFEEDVIPVAESIVTELVNVFNHLTTVGEDGDETTDEHGITIMGVLSTLQTILGLIEDHAEIVARVEPIVQGLILRILDAFASDYFDECTGLIENLITTRVSPPMWDIYDKMVDVFNTEKSLFFCDAMPCFYCFVTTDTDAFLSVPERVQKLLRMCGEVMADEDAGDDIRAGAVKILEVLIIQCQGRLDHYVSDIITLLVRYFAALPGTFNEFEAQIAVTLAAAFICNPHPFMATIAQLDPHKEQNFAWMFEKFFKGYKNLKGIHDCTMLLHSCIMAIRLPNRPPNLSNPQETMALFMGLFENIKRCRIAIAKNEENDSNSSDSSDEDEMNGSKRNIDLDLGDSDDDLNEGTQEYLSHLAKLDQNDSDSDDSEERHSFVEQTDLEEYETLFDGEEPRVNVYDQFIGLLEEIERNDPQYYQTMIYQIPAEKKPDFEELIALCRREQQHFRSKQVQQSGGYSFDVNAAVPTDFRFA